MRESSSVMMGILWIGDVGQKRELGIGKITYAG